MKKIKDMLRSKYFWSSVSVLLVLIMVIIACLSVGKDAPISLQTSPASTESISIEDETADSSVSDETDESAETSGEEGVDVDVGGNPGRRPEVSTVTSADETTSHNDTVSAQLPPSTTITTQKDDVQSKDTEPKHPPVESQNTDYPNNPNDWIPPPPGVGTGDQLNSGYEHIIVSPDKSIVALHEDIAAVVTSNLANSGYFADFWAGEVKNFVVDAVQNYAETDKIILHPEKYSLPKVTAQYNVKINAKGTNAKEAGNYVYDYLIHDQVFKDKINGEFANGNRGYLSVYQSDGYYFILAVMVDKNNIVQ